MSRNLNEDILRLNPNAQLQIGSFVLYRSEAALVKDISNEKKQIKLQIQTESGKKVSVRPKDIMLLSSAQKQALAELTQLLSRSELEDGWQLLQEIGRSCSLQDLAEAIFSGSGPREMYNAFCLINETPYFKGRPECIMVRSREEVAQELGRKQRKQAEAERWQRFYQHYQAKMYDDEDSDFIEEIEAIAYGEKQNCRLFRETKLEATPETAHEWLLRQGLWHERFNPYLRRNQVHEQAPRLEHLFDAAQLNELQQLIRDYQAVQAGLKLACEAPSPAGSAAVSSQQEAAPPRCLQQLEKIVGRFVAKQPLLYPSGQQAEGKSHIVAPQQPQPELADALPFLPTAAQRATEEAGADSNVKDGTNAGNKAVIARDIWHTESRKDLTHLAAWAIDDPWSNDPDDAISLELAHDNSSGTAPYLWIHIADPASLMPFGNPLATEAMQRGATIYIPEGATPMLNRELVQILGLGLQPVSMALSVKARVLDAGTLPPHEEHGTSPTPTLEVIDICRSWVRVRRISYGQADKILAATQAHPLQQIWKLCQSHEILRRRNHAVQFNMYNTKIVAGDPIQVESLPNTAARDLVAEAMLMAGTAMAQFAHQKQLPIAFLCQAPPKGELPPRDNMANMFQARKLMSPSMVRCEPQLHSSIGVAMYTRGTSPLRRYLDLLTHQQLHAFLLSVEGRELRPLNAEELLYGIAQAEMQISRVNSAQRAAQQHWQMLYFKQEGKKRLYRAVVLEIRHAHNSGRQQSGCKALCSLPQVGIETLVYTKEPLHLNQEIMVNLKSVNLSSREAHFQVAVTNQSNPAKISQDTHV